MASSVRFRVLGPLAAESDQGPVDLKGPRHRAVLARLLVARGRVVPKHRLVDDLWDRPPDGAVGTIHTFVAALRKALEPDRAPRAPAHLLVTASPGYALRAALDAVDAWRFEAAVAAAAAPAAEPEAVLSRLAEALGLWRGPAYAEFSGQAWARGEIARLDELRLVAVETRAGAMLVVGRAAEAVSDLEAQVEAHAWREDAWRLLALALYRVGRQGDALGALRRARHVLSADLGVDPGPDLRRLESDILRQAAHLDPRPPAAVTTAAALSSAARRLVGRADEWARLSSAATATVSRGRPGLVLVSGDAGEGKTALAEAFAEQLAEQGWTTAWGANPDDEGLPVAWPWQQILAALACTDLGPDRGPVLSASASAEYAATGSPTAADQLAARFHWHRAVNNYLGAVASRAPLLLVLDDLHWAGPETLALLAAVVAEQPIASATDPALQPPADSADSAAAPTRRPVLVVVTYRTTDVPAGLADFLGRAARAEPTRIYLSGLSSTAVGELVRATIGRPVDAATGETIARRSGGNPFFVRELARLFDAEGAEGLASVPPGVRDVVRRRVFDLPEVVQATVRQASMIGTEVDLDLLVLVSNTGDEIRADGVLDAVELATQRGFLVERGVGRFQFAHALVRDTIYEDVSRSRRALGHAAIAEVIERLRPAEVEALAYHFALADSPATAARAARYARAAAERAERRFAPHEAARLWQAALTAHDRGAANRGSEPPDLVGDDHVRVRARLELLAGLARALALTGALGLARHRRAEAITLAEQVDDPALTAQVIGAFDVPAIWTDNDDPVLASRVSAVTERTLASLPADQAVLRSRLLATLALELRSVGGDRARSAAREAERIARDLADPALLAFALNARFIQEFDRAGLASQRAGIGIELVELARRHELVTFEVLGHLVLVQARAALADFATADRHAAAADGLGDRYDIPLVGVFTDWYRALRTAVTGSDSDAEAAYRTAAARLAGTGMAGLAAGLLPFAMLCHRLQRGQLLGADPAEQFGSYELWCRPVVLLATGRRDEARVAASKIPTSPRDLLYEARTCLHARLAVAFDDRPTMRRLYDDLMPAAAELAGAGSGLLTLRPVAHHLGDLAAALGRPDRAAEHRRQAGEVAARAGAPHWSAAQPSVAAALHGGRA